ncbi:MAG: type VI secretion system tip protein TssI/VgrG, partial [Acidobacteriota bacterium]
MSFEGAGMAMLPQQTDRIAKLQTSLGKDTLSLTRFDGIEGISEFFEFTIEAVAEKSVGDLNAIIGQDASIVFEGQTAQRIFSGVVTAVDDLGLSYEFHTYRLTLRPWLWLLSHTSDCRIYHEMSSTDIIRDVFSRRGFQNFEFKTTENYEPREYCVQYRETDRDFVCRLMEEDGMYFYFKHDEGSHTLVIADSKSSHQPVPGLSTVDYNPSAIGPDVKVETISEIRTVRNFQPGRYALNEYDYKKPSASMKTDSSDPTGHRHDSLELYDYPGRY